MHPPRTWFRCPSSSSHPTLSSATRDGIGVCRVLIPVSSHPPQSLVFSIHGLTSAFFCSTNCKLIDTLFQRRGLIYHDNIPVSVVSGLLLFFCSSASLPAKQEATSHPHSLLPDPPLFSKPARPSCLACPHVIFRRDALGQIPAPKPTQTKLNYVAADPWPPPPPRPWLC
jgi:hypothetical protein